MDVDVAIIGSGAGGLAAAVALARAGKKVAVFEQHYLPGGWCHSFPLGGYKFSPGVHYLGELGPGGRARRIYEGLGVARDLTFAELDPAGYDRVLLGEGDGAFRFDYPKGYGALAFRLKSRFPHEARGIDGYLGDVRAMARELDDLMSIATLGEVLRLPFRAPTTTRWGLRSAASLLAHHVRDPKLRALLSAQAGDHGLPTSRVPAAIHGAVTAHYFDGGWYPRGGGGGLARAFVKGLRRHGGSIHVRTAVQKILVERGRAIGLRLADGTEVRAREVISNADPAVTFGRLLEPQHIGRLTRLRMKQRWSASAISLFFAVDMDLRAAGMTSANVWSYADGDVEGAYRRGLEAWGPDDGDIRSLFITATTLKDATKRGKQNEGHHTLEAFTFISYDAFKRWAGTTCGARPDDYQALKARLTEKMIAAIAKVLPGLDRHVVFAELGTPLTNVFYCEATEGNLYGTEKSRFGVGPFAHPIRTDVAGLRLCGASTLSHGVMGAQISGLFAAKDILGCTYDELLRGDGESLACVQAEDARTWGQAKVDDDDADEALA
jgi:phytoene dehydrogenase-like protein